MKYRTRNQIPTVSYLIVLLIIGILTAALTPANVAADGSGIDPFPGGENEPIDSTDTTGAGQSTQPEDNNTSELGLYLWLLSIVL